MCLSVFYSFGGLGAFTAAAQGTTTLATTTSAHLNAKAAARRFVDVVERLKPVAEQICHARAPQRACELRIVVDSRPNQPPNAYQTVDAQGRPTIVFTLSLIYLARNSNELALVMGHEAAHHIAGHYGKSRDNAFAGAVLGSVLAGLAGGDAAAMKTAMDRGATHGVQRHAIGFELEADAFGTRIAFSAGFDPKIGARIFTRISEPRDQSSATHPRKRLRIQAVRQTLAGLR